MVSPMSRPPERDRQVRSIALATLSLSVGAMVGLLTWSANAAIPSAVAAGISAFAAVIAILRQLTK
jgi:hypothetical protein